MPMKRMKAWRERCDPHLSLLFPHQAKTPTMLRLTYFFGKVGDFKLSQLTTRKLKATVAVLRNASRPLSQKSKAVNR